MEGPSKSTEDIPDPDFFNNIKVAIEKELDKMKKIVNNINQMRVRYRKLFESRSIGTINTNVFSLFLKSVRSLKRDYRHKYRQAAQLHELMKDERRCHDAVEAAYLESDLVLMIDASTWQDISELIGIGTSPMTDVTIKEENK